MCISYPKARMGHAKEKLDQSQWRALTVWCSVPLPGTQWWNMNFQKVWISLCKDFISCISWEFSPGLTLKAWDFPQQIAVFLECLPSRVLTDSLISHSWFCVAPSEGHPACNPNRLLHATCLPRLSALDGTSTTLKVLHSACVQNQNDTDNDEVCQGHQLPHPSNTHASKEHLRYKPYQT